MKLKSKYIIVQIPVATLSIWFLGWILYISFGLGASVNPYLYQNILGLLMIGYVFIALELARRNSWKSSVEGMLCPLCKQSLVSNSTLKPLSINYRCINPDCILSSKKGLK